MFKLIFVVFLISCSTEVGLMGYKNVNNDTSSSVTNDDQDADSSESPMDTSSDTDVEYENYGTTAYVHYKLRQVACPACLGVSGEISITFNAKFHDPIADSHTGWLPQAGTCTDNLYLISPSVIPISAGSSIFVNSGSHSFSVPQVGLGEYYTDSIWEAQYQRDTPYVGQTDLGQFAFTSSHGFDYIEPYTLLWVDPSYAYDTIIYRGGSSNLFTWGPSGDGSLFIITVAVYSWDGSQFLGRIDCAESDFGSMSIPGSYFQQFPSGSLAAVHMVRHKVVLTETDINNSFVETHMEWEVVGTAQLQ